MPTSNLISASKFLGKDRYDYYLNELITEKTLGGHQLSNAQLKEGFKKRTNKISFEKFVDKVISSKAVKASVNASPTAAGGLGRKGGALVKSPVGGIQKIQISADQKEVGGVGGYLKDIIGSLGNIIKVLNAGVSADIKNQEQKRRDRERSKRESVEKGLEKGFSAVKKIVEKVVAPVKSILSRIVDFFVKMFLARAVVKLIDWLADPKNASKVKSVIRFLGDWWPALLGSYILFGTSFGRFVRGITGLLARFIVQIGKVAIPGLLKFIARNPVGAAAVALFGAGAAAELVPGMTGQQEQKTKQAPGSTEDKIKALQQQKANLNIFQKMQGVGAEIDEQIFALQSGGAKSYGFSGGGFSGFVSGEKGVDKIPAMLSDGEFVMSAGAVQKYGVDTLEAMNAAGGGTNKPKIVGGTTYAVGGGPIGNIKDNPNYKDPILSSRDKLVRDLQSYARSQISSGGSVDLVKAVNNLSSTLKNTQTSSGRSKVPTGSLLTDPLGAIQRMSGVRGPNILSMPSGSVPNMSKPLQDLQRKAKSTISAVQSKIGIPKPSESKPGEKGFFGEIKEKLSGPGAATYRDAGSIYAKQMLGGFGGPISERDLSKDSQQELQKAIQRAKKRTGSEIAKAEAKIRELRGMGAKDGNPALETQKSFLRKLKSGGIRVQYADYADEKGKMSESAKNAKNILGQFWAHERSKKEGGGYRIEDKYDFDKMKDPMGVLFGKGKTVQQRLQALHQMNPLKGKGDVDMVLGGKRTAAESLGLTGSKTLLGGMLGISGKPKDKNTQTLEAKRPWWDKLGMFGGASAQMARDKKTKQEFLKKNPSVKLYDKPQKNTGEAYKSRFARPTNAGRTPVKPPVKPKPKVTVVAGGGQGGRRGSRGKTNTNTKAPAIKASHPSGTANKQANLNIRKK